MRRLVLLVLGLTLAGPAAGAVGRADESGGAGARADAHRAASDGAEVVGRSSQGRAIEVVRRGDPAAATTVLVVGSIHGTELAGHAVVAQLRRSDVPPGLRLLLVATANPDGAAAGTRQNARGVDLNRNFPYRWRARGRAFDTWRIDGHAVVDPATSKRLITGYMHAVAEADSYNVGGPYLLAGAGNQYFSDATHHDHVHAGFRV